MFLINFYLCDFVNLEIGTGAEVSSSSSETSLGGVSGRRGFPSRRGKAGAAAGRRHVRSSSGYSSHNDETTFR